VVKESPTAPIQGLERRQFRCGDTEFLAQMAPQGGWDHPHRIEQTPTQAQKADMQCKAQLEGIAPAGLNELALSTASGEKRLQLEGAYVPWQLMQAKVGGVPALQLVSAVIGADTIPAKKVNRKTNGIKGLRNYPHASASFPTVTFGNKNKSTPNGKVLDLAIREAVNNLVNGVDSGAWKPGL